jgi:hypothetical protein
MGRKSDSKMLKRHKSMKDNCTMDTLLTATYDFLAAGPKSDIAINERLLTLYGDHMRLGLLPPRAMRSRVAQMSLRDLSDAMEAVRAEVGAADPSGHDADFLGFVVLRRDEAQSVFLAASSALLKRGIPDCREFRPDEVSADYSRNMLERALREFDEELEANPVLLLGERAGYLSDSHWAWPYRGLPPAT